MRKPHEMDAPHTGTAAQLDGLQVRMLGYFVFPCSEEAFPTDYQGALYRFRCDTLAYCVDDDLGLSKSLLVK